MFFKDPRTFCRRRKNESKKYKYISDCVILMQNDKRGKHITSWFDIFSKKLASVNNGTPKVPFLTFVNFPPFVPQNSFRVQMGPMANVGDSNKNTN